MSEHYRTFADRGRGHSQGAGSIHTAAPTVAESRHEGKGVGPKLIDGKIDRYSIAQAMQKLFDSRRKDAFDSSGAEEAENLVVRFDIVEEREGRYITFYCASRIPPDADLEKRMHGLEMKAAQFVGHLIGLAGDPGCRMQHYINGPENNRISTSLPLEKIAETLELLYRYDRGEAVGAAR